MRIGYGKLGRSMPLTLAGCGTVGGDMEGISIITEMARRWPEHTFYLVGRNSGEDPADVGLPSNVVNPWQQWSADVRRFRSENNLGVTFEDFQKMLDFYHVDIIPFIGQLDAMVLWEGQHGTSTTLLPEVNDPSFIAMPQASGFNYCSYLLAGINAFRDRDPLTYEEIALNADARNMRQLRDLRWPTRHPVLAQFNTEKKVKFNRGRRSLLPTEEELTVPPEWKNYASRDGHLWVGKTKYTYSRLEINALMPGTEYSNLITFNGTWEERRHFGLFINEARAYVNPRLARKHAMKSYVLPLQPAFVHGKWTEASMQELGMRIESAPWEQYYPLLQSVRSTFTTPSSGSGWATTKPWEAFAAGTVCFFHPDYDSQNHILSDAPDELRSYLRPPTSGGLKNRVAEMNSDPDKWLHIVRLQREHFERAVAERRYMQMIEARLRDVQLHSVAVPLRTAVEQGGSLSGEL